VLAVTDEGASCAARAVSSDSVSCMLIAWRRLAHRFPDIVPGAAGESPQRRGLGKGEQRFVASRATRSATLVASRATLVTTPTTLVIKIR